ncbi:fatty acyl-CoA hydrolase precursor, medium chain-like [Argopecten irradians]|uniref:fatty acyl-CoA hydrolase precursor, medium chain-like n=1 Tax=Argopecten irradians TaxID=31199 RepID=UPI0037124993
MAGRILLILISLLVPCLCQNDTNVVELASSTSLRGILVYIPTFNSSVYQYRKIPFAKPPIGDLRFRKPVECPLWTGTRDATEFGSICMQDNKKNVSMSEDCLFLNVYTPSNTSASDTKAVMVFIHGGAYISGSGQIYDGSYLAISGDVIVVNMNYRLGFMGFMSTQDNASPGNYGLWDQQLALRWVRSHINKFGGDPNRITLFGESAGGFSVGLQCLYPPNRQLFHQAMAHSGVSNSVFATSPLAKKTAVSIGTALGCTTSPSTKLVKCLRSKSAEVIQNAIHTSTSSDNKTHYILLLAPVVDGDFLTDTPSNLLSNTSSQAYKFFRSINMVVGNVESEGSLILDQNLIRLQSFYNYNLTLGIPTRIVCGLIIPGIVGDWIGNYSDVTFAVCTEYTVIGGNTTKMGEQGNRAVQMYSDYFFLVPAIDTLNFHSQGNTQTKTFQFLLTRNAGWGVGEPYPSWLQGPGHFSEIPYLFGAQIKPHVQQQDLTLSQQMLKYWTNFAKNGDPNVGQTPEITWPAYTPSTGAYIDLDFPCSNATKMFEKRIHFWKSIVQDIIVIDNALSGAGTLFPLFSVYAITLGLVHMLMYMVQ